MTRVRKGGARDGKVGGFVVRRGRTVRVYISLFTVQTSLLKSRRSVRLTWLRLRPRLSSLLPSLAFLETYTEAYVAVAGTGGVVEALS
jgi:hypothetical protein